ncbi:MAG: phosphoglycerate mutase family protein, partial [Clostridia bacterium]|nr:phosphoglycerate mutase family protein [Clostridia bacterium]
MRLYLIRHGETKGNSEGRYVGVTDEGLTEKGREKLKNTDIKNVDRVYISP